MIYPPCSITGCDNPAHARGWCQKHYNRWYRHGGPEPSWSPGQKARSGIVRIPLSYVNPDQRAAAWNRQQAFDAAIVALCDHPVHVR